jgi:hypothetical protein
VAAGTPPGTWLAFGEAIEGAAVRTKFSTSGLRSRSVRITLAVVNRDVLHQEQRNCLSKPRRGGMTRTTELPGRDKRQAGGALLSPSLELLLLLLLLRPLRPAMLRIRSQKDESKNS